MSTPDRRFGSIVVPLNGWAESERALPVAVALAEPGAELTLVMVVSHADDVLHAEELLDRAAARVVGRSVKREVLVGPPTGPRLLQFLDREPRDIVVMATHAPSAVGELFVGSVADELVRGSKDAVVLVGPHCRVPEPGERYRELVACLDPGHDAALVLALARAAHTELGLHPWLFQVVAPLAPEELPNHGDISEAAYIHRMADALATQGVMADWEVGHGDDPAEVIVDFVVSRPSSIVALASRRRHPLERLRASSVTVGVARAATCPVICVAPPPD